MTEENGKNDYAPAPDPEEGQTLNLIQKLILVGDSVGYIQKSGEVKGYGSKNPGFTYAEAFDVFGAVQPRLAMQKVLFTTHMYHAEQTKEIIKDRDGNESALFRTQAKFQFGFTNGDPPFEKIERDWYGWSVGTVWTPYAAYGCMTGAVRHFLLTFFMILTGEDDPITVTKKLQIAYERDRNMRSEEAASRLSAPIVGSIPTPLKEDDLQNHDPDNPLPEEPENLWWEHHPLKMCKGLYDKYPDEKVGTIRLQTLIGSMGYVGAVESVPQTRDRRYDSVGHRQLAMALRKRMQHEILLGTIEKYREDGVEKYRLPKPKEVAPSLFSK